MPLPDIPDSDYNEWQAAKFASVASKRVASIGRPPAYIDSSSHQAFINGLLPLAQEWEGRTGIDAGTWLAMAASESNWGKAGTALFGIKGSGNAGSLKSMTWENVNGQRVTQSDNFATYKTAEDAFQGFWDLMQNPRYSSALKVLQNGGNGDAFVHEINRAGYATDPNWASSVRSIANTSIAPLVAQATPMGAQAPYPQGLNTTSGTGASAPAVSPSFPSQTPPAGATGFSPLSAVANAVRPLTDAVQEVPFEQFAQNLMSKLGAGPTPSGAGLPPQQSATLSDLSATPDQQDFGSYATGKIASLGYNDMAGVDTNPAPAFGANPPGVTSPIDQARDLAAPPPQSAAPADTFGAMPPPLGYNDMAGVDTNPVPAFGSNPQDASSPIVPTTGYTPLLPGPTPLTDIPGNVATAIVNRVQDTAATNQYAFNPTLGTRADQPARSQVVGGSRMLGQFTPEQLAAQQDLGFNAVLGVTGGDDVARVAGEAFDAAKAVAPYVGPLADQGVPKVVQPSGEIGLAGRVPEPSPALPVAQQVVNTPAVAPAAKVANLDSMIADTQKLIDRTQGQINNAKMANDTQLASDLQEHLNSSQSLLRRLQGEQAVAGNKVAGPVAGRGPGDSTASVMKIGRERLIINGGEDPAAPARAAVAAAVTPDGKRLPIWMKPVAQVIGDDVPALAGAPERAPLGVRPTGTLPSGRTPGGLGDPRSKPLTIEPAGAALERALAVPVKGFAQQVEDASGKIMREGYDRLYPLRALDDAAGLGPNVGSHAMGQVVSGAIAAGEDNARRFVMPVIEGLRADGTELEQWMVLQQSRDVLAKYPESRLPGNIDGRGGIQREEALIKQKLGPERFAKMQEAAKKLWAMNDELRLKPLQEEGFITTRERATLRNENPHYIPFDRYVHSNADPSTLLPRTSQNLSVSSTGIKARTATGAVHALDQPLARWTADIIQTPMTVSRNRAARGIVEALQEVEKRTGQKLVVVAPESAATTAKLGQSTVDRGSISFYDPKNPGVKMVANVPKIYETVAKGLESESANVLSNVMSALATPLRLGATGLDPTFLAVNAIRDLQSAWVREGLHPLSPYAMQGLKAALARNTDFAAAAQAGALHSGLMETRHTTDAIKRAKQLKGIQVNNATDALLVLPRLVAAVPGAILKANEVVEQTTRIGTYLKLRAEGLSELESGVRARDVSVDFDKSGNSVRVINQAIPFLNAREQGGANLIRTLRDNPKQAAMRLAPFVAADVIFWAWNQRYSSFNLIPPYEFDRNYIFQIGEAQENQNPKNPNAAADKIPIYIKIPRGDPSSVTGAATNAMLRIAFQQGDRSAVEILLHAAQAATQGLSPIDPTSNSALSSLTPPILSTSQQIAMNRDTFRGRDIVPQGEMGRPPSERYDQTTSRTAVALGQQFGVSPRMIDFAIRNYAGGTGRNVEWLSDVALGALGYDPQAPGQTLRQQRTPIEEAATMPGVSRFIGARNTGEQIVSAQNMSDTVSQSRDLLYQNPEIKRFGMGFNPVGQSITYHGTQIPLTPDEQVQYQNLLSQQIKTDVDALINRDAYKGYKTDALKKRAIDSVMAKSRSVVEGRMLQDIGSNEIQARVRKAS